MRVRGKLAARSWRAALAGLLALLAAGCSDTDDGGPGGAVDPDISGTAAVGAPITGGTVTAKCSGGRTFSATTRVNGSYVIEAVPSSALPCALQVSGGKIGAADNTQNFHGYTASGGVVNLTPLTDLAVALASGMIPSDWFNGIAANTPPKLDNLSAAARSLLAKLRGAGYQAPDSLNPLTSSFTPGPTDPYDQLLEALAASLTRTGSSYAELLIEVVEEGEDFTPPPEDDEEEPVPGGETMPGTVSASLVGSYTLTYFRSKDGGPFTDQQQVPAVVGGNNTLTINGKTLGSPFFRKVGESFNQHELIWEDAAGKIEYALSDNQSGVFNEINVGDTTQPVGNQRFLGQLRKPAGALPAGFGGSYAPLVRNKSGSLFNGYATNSAVTVVVDGATGRVDVDGGAFVVDPGDPTFQLQNNTNSTVEPNYAVSIKSGTAAALRVRLYVQDGQITSFEVRRGTGLDQHGMDLELRPLPANVLAFFDLAVAKTPVVLTVVQDDPTYNSGYSKCEQIRLTTFRNGSGDTVGFTYFLHRGSEFQEFVLQETYARHNTFYLENSGNKILKFQGNRISLRADNFVDLASGLGGVDKDRATNDPTQVSANCPAP